MANHINKPSLTALLLGFGGLIPFIGLSCLSVLTLSAIHWGLTMSEPSPHSLRLVWGVIPSLVAWLSLIFSTQVGLAMECSILWVCFLVDYKTYPHFNLSAWLKLRFALTLIASVSLLAPLALINMQ